MNLPRFGFATVLLLSILGTASVAYAAAPFITGGGPPGGTSSGTPAPGAASTVISTTLCGIIITVQTVVGVIALVLFILGGALYAVAHMLPAAGNLRGNLQGWSLGMIVGGIVGLIIVIIAPSILSIIASTGTNITIPSC
jgi:hypothetical protein